MWPSSGSDCAARIRGCAFAGPGPISRRWGTCAGREEGGRGGSRGARDLLDKGLTVGHILPQLPGKLWPAALRAGARSARSGWGHQCGGRVWRAAGGMGRTPR
jgi:hypothetical protein